ncbi:MAG: hypothetical protein IJW21_03985 [Clostridia bacterium]|nr:hypothetical protein [Clostridia bacterium]
MDSSKKRINKKVIASALLCMFAFIYVIHHIGNAFKEKTELFTVTYETLENTVDLSGYIFRDETVLYGTGLACTYNFADGEKVAKNASVANVYYTDNAELREKYDDLRGRIAVLEQSSSLLHIELEEVDAAIAALRTEIAVKSAGGNMAFLAEAETELLVLLHKRSLAEQNKSDYSAELAALRAELAVIQSSVTALSMSVNAPGSGYFYSYTDGYESVFTAEAAQNMSFESYDAIAGTAAQKNPAAVGKVAAGGKWYFVCKTTVESAEEIVADCKYNCVFTDNSCEESLPLFAEKKLADHESGEALLVFSCTYMPDDFDFSRMQRAKLTAAEISGLRVPASAVRATEGQTIVYIIKEGICRPRNIKILFEKGGYCVVSEPEGKSDLALYDRIIIGEAELYDGKVIDY